MCKAGNISTLQRRQVRLERWVTLLLLNAVVMVALKPLGSRNGSIDAHSDNYNEAPVTSQPRKTSMAWLRERPLATRSTRRLTSLRMLTLLAGGAAA